MKPCPFCGEQIQDAAAKCRFCFEWLDPTKRPSWSTDEQAPAREQPGHDRATASVAPTSVAAVHEVARPADLPHARATAFEREVSRPKPIASLLDQAPATAPAPASPLLGPDARGRAGGAVEAEARPAPVVPPRYQAPGPFPQGQPSAAAPPLTGGPRIPPMVAAAGPEPTRALGQPAPAPRSRWQPGDEGTKPSAPAWQPPAFDPRPEPEPEPEYDEVELDVAPEPGASVWTPPNWLLSESKPNPAKPAASETPSWSAPPQSPPATATPSWGPAASPPPPGPGLHPQSPPLPGLHPQSPPLPGLHPQSPPPGTPAWTPPDHTPIWSPRTDPSRPPVAAHDDEFDDGEFEGPRAPVRRPEPEPELDLVRHRRRGRVHEAIEDEPARAERPRLREPEPEPEPAPAKPVVIREVPLAPATMPAATIPAASKPAAAAASIAPAPAKPKAKRASDDDDDDDDDDFDDDDDDDADDEGDDETGSMPAMSDQAMSAAANRPTTRKLPWVAIAGVSGALVLILAFVFKDAIFGGGDEPSNDEVAADSGATEPTPTPTPEPKDEPAPEPDTKDEPAPEPTPAPPAIDPAELEDKLAEADGLYRKAKHDKAREVLDDILGKAPKEPRALALLAQVLLEKGEFETALTTANDCVAVNDQESNCWMTIAVIEQENKNFPRALEGYRKYLEIAPDGRFATSAKKQVARLEAKVAG